LRASYDERIDRDRPPHQHRQPRHQLRKLASVTAAHVHAGANGPIKGVFGVPAGFAGAGHFAGSVAQQRLDR